MTTTTTGFPEPAEDFSTSEGLRALLIRLHEGGEDAWVHDPVARDLMEFAADKYRALARKHKLDTWEAVAAAFDAMQYRSTREANDLNRTGFSGESGVLPRLLPGRGCGQRSRCSRARWVGCRCTSCGGVRGCTSRPI